MHLNSAFSSPIPETQSQLSKLIIFYYSKQTLSYIKKNLNQKKKKKKKLKKKKKREREREKERNKKSI
jgi:hypothetical protein